MTILVGIFAKAVASGCGSDNTSAAHTPLDPAVGASAYSLGPRGTHQGCPESHHMTIPDGILLCHPIGIYVRSAIAMTQLRNPNP